MEVVGQNALGGRGFNGDVWVHEDHAYIGHWGFQDGASGSKNRFCPQPPHSGVAVVDATDPDRTAGRGDAAEPRRHLRRGCRRVHRVDRPVRWDATSPWPGCKRASRGSTRRPTGG